MEGQLTNVTAPDGSPLCTCPPYHAHELRFGAIDGRKAAMLYCTHGDCPNVVCWSKSEEP